MRIPRRGLAGWCHEIIRACTQSRPDRARRGIAYRNLFLAGDEDGIPQTFLRTQDFIRDLQAFLYSPIDLRFSIDYYGQASPAERAKGKAAAASLYQYIRDGKVDTSCSAATLWALVKGKTLFQMVWTRRGLEPYIVQPELFGVLREDISDLDRQEAFVHTTFLTKSRFAQMIAGMPSADQTRIIDGVKRFAKVTRGGEAGDQNNMLKQIMIGGLYPYAAQGQTPNATSGVVNWLTTPQPQLRPDVMEDLIAYDQLWVWDDDADDWATITMVGDVIVFGKDQLFNAFASQFDANNKARRPDTNRENPLRGKHNYIEFCAQPMDSYFWGRSSVADVALLQRSINQRIDGINKMLRKQEDPPRVAKGAAGVNQNAYAKLNRPGGFMTDASPAFEIKDIVQGIPADVWRSFHELNGMFDIIGGFPAVTRGEGESGVRAQGHAETLLRSGSARHKDAALLIERSVEEVGGLSLDMLKAKVPDQMIAWVMPGTNSIETTMPIELDPTLEPPVKGMQPIAFSFADLSDKCKVTVDAHSSSPAFSYEARQLAFALAQRGAMSPSRLIEAVHPSNEDALVEDAERQEIQKAQLMREHPELVLGRPPGRPRTH